MKKVFTFVAALLISAMAMAVTITSANLTIKETDDGFTVTDQGYTLTASSNGGSNKPTKNTDAGDLRLYAKNKLTISGKTMTKMVFAVSKKGKFRQAEITASTGSVVVDATNWTVPWTGEATSVDLTVGEKAVYGTDGETKAGQFDFDAITITSGEGGGEGGEGEGGEGEGEGGEGEGLYLGDENTPFNAEFWSVTLDESYFEEYGDVYVDSENSDKQVISLDITDYGYADGVFTPGTYEINDTYEDGTVYAGYYYIDEEDEEYQFIVPSFAGIIDNEDYVDKVWYIVSGTVTISDDVIVVDAVNSLGKSVTATIHLLPTSVENTEANVQSAIKTLRNGQVLIQKNNKVYTILGQEVK